MTGRRLNDEISIEFGALGQVVMRMERVGDGAPYVEVRFRMPVDDGEAAGRRQVLALLVGLEGLADEVARRRRLLRGVITDEWARRVRPGTAARPQAA